MQSITQVKCIEVRGEKSKLVAFSLLFHLLATSGLFQQFQNQLNLEGIMVPVAKSSRL